MIIRYGNFIYLEDEGNNGRIIPVGATNTKAFVHRTGAFLILLSQVYLVMGREKEPSIAKRERLSNQSELNLCSSIHFCEIYSLIVRLVFEVYIV